MELLNKKFKYEINRYFFLSHHVREFSLFYITKSKCIRTIQKAKERNLIQRCAFRKKIGFVCMDTLFNNSICKYSFET